MQFQNEMMIDTTRKQSYNPDHPSKGPMKQNLNMDDGEDKENRQIDYEDLNDEFGNVSVSGKLFCAIFS